MEKPLLLSWTEIADAAAGCNRYPVFQMSTENAPARRSEGPNGRDMVQG
jgi:hypothetical protein